MVYWVVLKIIFLGNLLQFNTSLEFIFLGALDTRG